ncbi:outer membrane protein assembly factor BamD [Burkholderiaceae bacterium FT117]|uniref:outer membrane protein assembly factor BamD n=1 Tax=Zeimonas sediminis TaxID=2944268 RepID=UPI002342C203|nr:outer membrane protein assembly factor BamD [Zeimonas sediminis]MCM5569116.1 outer membrane protein assembly factor BamD [Zeimonas sediminis]
MKSTAFRLRAVLAAMVVALAACGTSNAPDPTLGWSPDRLYAEAKEEMASANYPRAVQILEKLESRYPFGRWAQQAQLEIAWAHYKDGERALALAAIDRFLRLHPEHPALDYALYLKGLINFNEQQGLIAWLGGQDLAERDLQAARESFDSFKQLVTRFPQSKYAADAEARMTYLVGSMARGEMLIARYYFQRGAYVAAANRAQEVVRKYQQAPAVEDALAILVLSYDKLELNDLRDDAKRVLDRNFPDSEALERVAASDDRRWWQVWR